MSRHSDFATLTHKSLNASAATALHWDSFKISLLRRKAPDHDNSEGFGIVIYSRQESFGGDGAYTSDLTP